MAEIVDRILDIIARSPSPDIKREGMKCILRITSSSYSMEEAALGKAVPVVIETAKTDLCMVEAIGALSALV